MSKKSELIAGGMAAPTASALGGSVVTGLTALAAGGQAGATPLTGTVNVVAVCATSADSCMLPVGDAGDEIVVRNNGAAPCAVFPQVGGAINGGSANAAFTVTNAKAARFTCLGGLNWVAMLSA